jgi:hypothetical protein
MYATDRQIIERLLIPALMQVVLLGMRKSLGEDAGVLDPVTDLLGEALREPLANLPPERVAKLVRRSKRVTEQAFAPVTGKLFGVQYLTIARFTADLAEREPKPSPRRTNCTASSRTWDSMWADGPTTCCKTLLWER